MTPTRPYFLRAIYDWIVDNQCTPFLVVDATVIGVKVPVASIEDGQIVLNIAPSAVANFVMDNDAVSFSARFSGEPFAIYVPVAATLGLYASENGQGMAFPEEAVYEALAEHEPLDSEELDAPSGPRPTLSAVTDAGPSDESSSEKTDKPSPNKKKPSLKVIK